MKDGKRRERTGTTVSLQEGQGHPRILSPTLRGKGLQVSDLAQKPRS